MDAAMLPSIKTLAMAIAAKPVAFSLIISEEISHSPDPMAMNLSASQNTPSNCVETMRQFASARSISRHKPTLEVQMIIEKHCVSCHAEEPSNKAFAIAPKGIMLDTVEKIIFHKDQIYKQAVLSKAMPIINTTNMTDQEREKLGIWVEAN